MDTQEHLDKWLRNCVAYYNKHSLKQFTMKTTEERIQQLEQAHGRLHNQFQTFHQDFINYRKEMQDQLTHIKDLIKQVQQVAAPAEPEELPEELLNKREYKAVVQSVVKTTPVQWKNMDYQNVEVKLVGKPDYVYVAFIPAAQQVTAGDNVRFTYAHPFQLKHLKVR
jgi:predicted nuclease with TOPRIM domain